MLEEDAREVRCVLVRACVRVCVKYQVCQYDFVCVLLDHDHECV